MRPYEPFIGPSESSGSASENTLPQRTSRLAAATLSSVK